MTERVQGPADTEKVASLDAGSDLEAGAGFHTIRTRDGGRKRLKYGRKQAIQLMCMECMGWETSPRECTAVLCPLYPYRGVTMASQKGE